MAQTQENQMEPTQESAAEERKKTGGVSIRIIGAVCTVIAILLAFFAFTLAGKVAVARDDAAADEKRFVECSAAIDDLQVASDYLTSQARLAVVAGSRECVDNYVNEILVEKRRSDAVDTLRAGLVNDQGAAEALEQALTASDKLAERELAAMRLAADHYKYENVPDMVANADMSMTATKVGDPNELEVAKKLVMDSDYDDAKEFIQSKVEESSKALLADLDEQLERSDTLMQNLLFQLRITVALLLCVVMVLVLALFMYVLKPLDRYVKRIEKNEPLEADGAFELHYLANAYNIMYEDNSKRIEQLRQYAERDPLTGISNRSGYANFFAKHTRDVALLLIDIDNFKEFNTVYGHDTGDAVMIKLAGAICEAFRSTDFPCRIESDKFAIIMTNMSREMHDAVTSKVDLVNSIMADDSDDLPIITFSVGVAFSAEGMNDDDIYRAASAALLQAQENANNEIVFYGEQRAAEE